MARDNFKNLNFINFFPDINLPDMHSFPVQQKK